MEHEVALRTGVVRWAWLTGGLFAVGFGGLGIIVPGLPTTVFFIAAAACFTRSSPRLEQWVLDLPKVGPMVRSYRAGLGMSRRAKVIACACIVGFSSFAILTLSSTVARLVITLAALIGVWYVTCRVPTRESVLAAGPPT